MIDFYIATWLAECHVISNNSVAHTVISVYIFFMTVQSANYFCFLLNMIFNPLQVTNLSISV